MQNSLAHNAGIQAMSNAQKQELAENLQLLTILTIIAHRENQRTKNEKNSREFRQNRQRENLKMRIDLEKLKLTDQGLV